MGLIFQNLLGVFSFLLIHSLSFASSRATRIDILNNCTYTVWAAAYPGGGKQLKQGEKWTLSKITGSGRIWGRTKCAFGHDDRGKCETGDCDGDLECQTNGRAPNTLGEYSINQAKRNDIFYISVVEGFNIPMEFRPAASSSPSSNCSSVSKCAADVNGPCPMELRDPGGCNNPCTVFSNSQFCCTSGLSTCGATSYSKFFKDLCLHASTYPSDVAQRSSCPTGIDYNVVFCPPNEPGKGVNEIVTRAMFDQMLKHRNDNSCPGNGFYTYDAFVTAATFFNGFGNEGDYTTRARELAAFFGQTSHETTGGWTSAPNGPYAWGYCFVRENGISCANGTVCYYGRGPFQLTGYFNYKAAGEALGIDLINDPDLVVMDPVVSFKTAIWLWMTPEGNRPSSHDVIVGRWTPSSADKKAGRVPGYGAITNIINGGIECGRDQNDQVVDRIGFYKRYCDILGVAYGDNLDCYNQQPFA